eukprot:6194310-Pleurochrysis_carterae.AAC.1
MLRCHDGAFDQAVEAKDRVYALIFTNTARCSYLSPFLASAGHRSGTPAASQQETSEEMGHRSAHARSDRAVPWPHGYARRGAAALERFRPCPYSPEAQQMSLRYFPQSHSERGGRNATQRLY